MQHIFGLLFILAAVSISGLLIWMTIKSQARIRAEKAATIKVAKAVYDQENKRVAALPKLDTTYLILVPRGYSPYWNGKESPMKRSYGTRYNRILIVDEDGNAWVGLVTSDIVENLIRGEYIHVDYWIPFRGAGEMIAGQPVQLEGLMLDIYPQWMTAGESIPEWDQWVKIERNFGGHSRFWNYQAALSRLNGYMNSFHEKRDKLQRLQEAATASRK